MSLTHAIDNDPDFKRAVDVLYTIVADSEEPLSVTSTPLKKAVRAALKMKRLSKSRFRDVIAAATKMYPMELSGDTLLARDYTEKPASSQEDTNKAETKVSSTPASKKSKYTAEKGSERPASYMGRILESRLREADSVLPAGVSSASIFCHCPHCGTPLNISAAIKSS